MRRVLCTLLYRLRLRRWAYKVSPSIYCHLYGQEVQAALVAGLHDGLRAKVQLADELHSPADRCVCCGEIIPEGRMVCPNCENGVQSRERKKV